jgi:hypothetical protein
MKKIIKILVKIGLSEKYVISHLKVFSEYFYEKGRQSSLNRQLNLKEESFEEVWKKEIEN